MKAMYANPFVNAYESERTHMVGTQLRARGIRDERVLQAMERVPRHIFVGPELQAEAYSDNPVAIGEGQTVSQPFIVAFMLQALELAPEHKVLEVGTGTGYQAALLGELARQVISIERHAALAEMARNVLHKLGYQNLTVVHGDGSQGFAELAPYERIIVAAAAPYVPPSLIEQLAEGGRMIIPVGGPDMQELQLLRKIEGGIVVSGLEACRFVPLVGEQGFQP